MQADISPLIKHFDRIDNVLPDLLVGVQAVDKDQVEFLPILGEELIRGHAQRATRLGIDPGLIQRHDGIEKHIFLAADLQVGAIRHLGGEQVHYRNAVEVYLLPVPIKGPRIAIVRPLADF